MTPRVEALEGLRTQAWDSSSSSHTTSRPANRHGHRSRMRSISAADEREVADDSRFDMLSSINTALRNVAAKPVESKPCRIIDLIPRSWEGNKEKEQFRSFMSDLHMWMQAWSNQGEMILTGVERVDKFDSSATAVGCPEAEFRLIEASLCHVLHRTTANEPLRIVQQIEGQK